MTLSVGFVVDDAIVMLENIVRHIEGGMRPFEAALKGAREIGFTIVSITFSLIAVFIPVLLMGGMVGRVFREFAVTIAVAIIVSGFVSLTLTPMLCARMLRAHQEGEKENIVLRAFEAMFRGWLRAYEWTLDKVLAYKSFMLVVTLATLVGTVWLYVIIPKGFFPTEDTGFIAATTEGASDISFQAMVERQRQVAEIVTQRPGGRLCQLDGRRRRPQPDHQLRAPVHRAQAAQGARENSTAVIQRLRRTANTVTGMIVYFQNVQNINITGRISKSEYQYTLQSSDTETLYRVAPELRDKIAKIDGLRDVTTDLYIKNPQMTIEIDREQAAVYGITVDQIRQELFNAFGSRQVATIYTPSNDYQVILESLPEFQADPASLSKIFLKTNVNATGGGSTLRRHAGRARRRRRRRRHAVRARRSRYRRSPASCRRSVRCRSTTRASSRRSPISFNLAPGNSLGQAVDAIKQIERDSNLPAADRDRLPGHRAGVPGVAEGAGRPGAGGDLRRLCGARHPLRELHPSDHHHLRPAVGRRRRAADADGVQHGPVGDRHDRHRDAGRHRQEERDHDDRLRDRAPARRPRPPRRRSARPACCASGRS